MTVLIQDCARNNVASWAENALGGGDVSGVMLSPFCSPRDANGYKPSPEAVSERVRAKSGDFWFDPSTHVLQMPSVGDFRYYAGWDLWGGARGDLSTTALQTAHVRKVFATQRALNARLLAPTLLLHSSQSSTSLQAIELARVARIEAQDGELWLSVVGDSHFWSSGTDLDGFIGTLDQLNPTGWVLSVARPLTGVPAAAEMQEISGLMRTTLALSQNAEVVIGHGDLAALPAAAVGATTLGSGWDVRQRVLAYPDFAERATESGTGGAWYSRPTLLGLFGSVLPTEFSVLSDQRPTLASALYAGAYFEGPENAFRHHAQVLNASMAHFVGLSAQQSVELLRDQYLTALGQWPTVQGITRCATAGDQWISSLLAGLDQFISDEGWS